jgi:hypothetical protein
MDIAHGETKGNGGTETKGMKVNAIASTESMKVKAMASTEGMKVKAMARVEATAVVEAMAAVEGTAAVEVEVEGMAEGKISKELGNALYRRVPSCLINGEHDTETAAPSRLDGHSASEPGVGTFFLTSLSPRCM